MSTVSQHNAGYFTFLRRRSDFVASLPSDSIEGYLLWGAAVDALARIHARRTTRALKPNGACFVRALNELLPQFRRVSVPLLAHDLRYAKLVFKTQVQELDGYRSAVSLSRIWSWTEDPLLDSVLLCAGGDRDLVRLIQRNSYAHLLYEEYRCCAVHGLELGHKTFSSPERRDTPSYMNYLYAADDPRPQEVQVRTRLCFSLDCLANALRQAIDTEEKECTRASFTIPPYPTLDS